MKYVVFTTKGRVKKWMVSNFVCMVSYEVPFGIKSNEGMGSCLH